MARNLVPLVIAFVIAAPVWAAGLPGTISGTVRNSGGVAQMGAVVEVLASSAVPVATVFTDSRGYFEARGIHAGNYQIKVTAPSFLPSLREDLTLKPGANLIVNVTLNTLFEAMQLAPIRRRTAEDQDDWRWTLRSAANRPILRVLDDGPLVVVAKGPDENEKTLKAHVAFFAGSGAEGFGSAGEMTTAFKVERSLFTAGKLSVGGNVGYNTAGFVPGTVFRASYSHRMANGSEPQVAVTARRFATPGMAARNAALQALAVSLSDNFSLMDFVDVEFGSEYQVIQFMRDVSAIRPFGSVDFHLSPNTVVEYRYTTSRPTTRAMKGFDSAPADLTEADPRVSLSHSVAMLERARHHEVSLSRRIGRNSIQVAAYTDRISDPALIGVGDVADDTRDFLPDVYSGTFTWNGARLNSSGLRVVMQRKLTDDLTATVGYSYGGVLQLDQAYLDWSRVRDALENTHQHALAYKMAGTIPLSQTQWVASYKWSSGQYVLTPVDMFNSSPGQADPYLNVFVRQPIPGTGFMPGHMEALVDVRNLLAQGYVPVFGSNGQTLYLVQSARAVRGGVAFTF
ncbi:MAG: carboxypeptidase-like regulatory domain-containing protein [Terriglobales bacterium]